MRPRNRWFAPHATHSRSCKAPRADPASVVLLPGHGVHGASRAEVALKNPAGHGVQDPDAGDAWPTGQARPARVRPSKTKMHRADIRACVPVWW